MILLHRHAIEEAGERIFRKRKWKRVVKDWRKTIAKPENTVIFPVDLPQKQYANMCRAVAKRFKGIIDVQVQGPRVTCFLRRWNGTTWTFYYEHRLDGEGILERPNVKSEIPEQYVALLTERIKKFRDQYSKGWPTTECPCCNGKMIQEPRFKKWGCLSCGYELSDDEMFLVDKQETSQEQEKNQKAKTLFLKKHINRMIHKIDSTRADQIDIHTKSRDERAVSQNLEQNQNDTDRAINYCPYCGTHVESHMGKYCYNCGKRL